MSSQHVSKLTNFYFRNIVLFFKSTFNPENTKKKWNNTSFDSFTLFSFIIIFAHSHALYLLSHLLFASVFCAMNRNTKSYLKNFCLTETWQTIICHIWYEVACAKLWILLTCRLYNVIIFNNLSWILFVYPLLQQHDRETEITTTKKKK